MRFSRGMRRLLLMRNSCPESAWFWMRVMVGRMAEQSEVM